MTIQGLLLNSFKTYSKNDALFTNNQYFSYKQLEIDINNISSIILSIAYEQQPVIIMGSRSYYTHVGILGTIMSGSYYVPLNEIFPYERNISIIKISGAKTIILDKNDFNKYEEILDNISGYNIICTEKNIEYLRKRFPNNVFHCSSQPQKHIISNSNDAVYMLFTSGSTGIPKGIKISHYNLYNYIQAYTKRNIITKNDRFIQMNDLTFDLSAHSLFLSLCFGACLYIPSSSDRINPIKFIHQHSITHILMVPSSITFMKKMRVLKDNALLSVKYMSFCGETLPFDNAILMAKVASNAKLENLYGPTEATIACTYFEFNQDTKELPEYSGSMPIGKAYDGMKVELYDENLNLITDESTGQIVLSGKQLTNGYVNNPEQTKEKFIMINNELHYLTGDLGRIVNGEIVFLGRNDAQVQIKGYRVEIFEIENAISKIDGIISNAVIPTPIGAVTYENTTAFIMCSTPVDIQSVKTTLNNKLPAYMVPNNYIILDNMPLNTNGKIDRNQLKKLLQ